MPEGIGYGRDAIKNKRTNAPSYDAAKKRSADSKKKPSSKKPAKKKEISKGRKKIAAGMKAFGDSMSKADPMSAVRAKEMPVVGKSLVNAMKKASAESSVSDSEYKASMKKLRANKLNNDRKYKK